MRASTSIFACGRRGYPLRPHTRSGGAPNYAPSLRSVAGLLGRSLDAAYEDTLASLRRLRAQPRVRGGLSRPGQSARSAARASARAVGPRVLGARIASTSAAMWG